MMAGMIGVGCLFAYVPGAALAASASKLIERVIVKEKKDQDLADIFASLELISRFELRSGLRVTIYRSLAPGECDPGREATTCPKSRLIIVKSLNKEGPDENQMWMTEELVRWNLLKQPTEYPDQEQSEVEKFFGVIGFEAIACRPTKQDATTNQAKAAIWHKERYQFLISRVGLQFRNLQPTEEVKQCE